MKSILLLLALALPAPAMEVTPPPKSVQLSGNANIGIGTASPATLLDVNGSAQFGSGAAKSTFTAAGGIGVADGFTMSGTSVTVAAPLAVTFGSTRATVGGSAFYSNYSIVATTTTTAAAGVVGFSTFTFPAGSLNSAGMCVVMTCQYTWSGTANSKVVHVLVNGSSYDSYSQTTAASGVEVAFRLCRISASTADWFFSVKRETATPAFGDQGASSTSLDFAAAISFSCAGAGATADGDVSFRTMKVLVEP